MKPTLLLILTVLLFPFSALSQAIIIGDVLKKLQGIEIAPSGKISYNGMDVNKFYVESLDLLQGRYGIATNNNIAAAAK